MPEATPRCLNNRTASLARHAFDWRRARGPAPGGLVRGVSKSLGQSRAIARNQAPVGRKLCMLACICLLGCRPVAQPDPVQAADEQVPWEEQVRQVREEHAIEIRYDVDPVHAAELLLLKDDCQLLRILEVNQDLIAAETVGEVLKSLPRLERLKLTGPVSDEILLAVSKIPTLKILNLPNGEFSDNALRSIAGHPALELLRFHSPHVTDDGFASVSQIPHLRFLHVIDVPMTDAGLQHLSGLEHLESFYLDGGDCTEAGLSELIKRLPELHFHWNQLHLPEDPRTH